MIEFTAKWCGPCKSLEPKLEELAANYTDVEFVKIDVDVLMVIINQSFFPHFLSQSLKKRMKSFQQKKLIDLSYKITFG